MDSSTLQWFVEKSISRSTLWFPQQTRQVLAACSLLHCLPSRRGLTRVISLFTSSQQGRASAHAIIVTLPFLRHRVETLPPALARRVGCRCPFHETDHDPHKPVCPIETLQGDPRPTCF